MGLPSTSQISEEPKGASRADSSSVLRHDRRLAAARRLIFGGCPLTKQFAVPEFTNFQSSNQFSRACDTSYSILAETLNSNYERINPLGTLHILFLPLLCFLRLQFYNRPSLNCASRQLV